jgi:hypothetical protein
MNLAAALRGLQNNVQMWYIRRKLIKPEKAYYPLRPDASISNYTKEERLKNPTKPWL